MSFVNFSRLKMLKIAGQSHYTTAYSLFRYVVVVNLQSEQ